MSALTLSGIIFVLTLGGIFLGTLLRRTLPEHHLNEHAGDVVRLGVGLIATIAALVLGLLIAAAKGSFDTQTSQVRQITANLNSARQRSGPVWPGSSSDPRANTQHSRAVCRRALAREGSRHHGPR
jgi:hypothetical protein